MICLSLVCRCAGDGVAAVQVLALTDCESLQSSHLATLRWLTALQSLDLSRCARLDSFALRHIVALPCITSLSLQVWLLWPVPRLMAAAPCIDVAHALKATCAHALCLPC